MDYEGQVFMACFNGFVDVSCQCIFLNEVSGIFCDVVFGQCFCSDCWCGILGEGVF